MIKVNIKRLLESSTSRGVLVLLCKIIMPIDLIMGIIEIIYSVIISYSTFVILIILVGKCKCTGVLPVFTTISPDTK